MSDSQKTVTKWACHRMHDKIGYMVKSEEFRVTSKMYIMTEPKDLSADSSTVFGFSTRFNHDDPLLCDSRGEAIDMVEKVEHSKIEVLRAKIDMSEKAIAEIRQFRKQCGLETS